MKIDTATIEGFEEMSVEDKLKALINYEMEVPAPKDNAEEVNKLKTALSKANSDAAEWKRQFREKQTEAERAEAERKERAITPLRRVHLSPHSVNTHLSRGLSPRLSPVFAATKMSTRRCGSLPPLLGKESLSARTIHARSPRRNLRERWNPLGFRRFHAILFI